MISLSSVTATGLDPRARARAVLRILAGRHEDAEPDAEEILAAALASAMRDARRGALEEAAQVAEAVAAEDYEIADNRDAIESDRLVYRFAATGAEEVAGKLRTLAAKKGGVMHDYDAQAQHERERHYHDLAQAEAQLHDAGLTTGDLTEAQVFAVARALTAAVEQERRRCLEIVREHESSHVEQEVMADSMVEDDAERQRYVRFHSRCARELNTIATRIAGEGETR